MVSNESVVSNIIAKIIISFILIMFLAGIFIMSNQDGKDSNMISQKVTKIVEKYISHKSQGKYLKIIKEDKKITAFYSYNGVDWNMVGTPVEIDLSENSLLGLAVTSHNNTELCSALFDNFKYIPSSSSNISDEWKNIDVGVVGNKGSSDYKNGVWTIKGSGDNISGDKNDGFQYNYREVKGNFEISIRVTSIQKTHSSAKAGIMLRQSLNEKSVYAGVFYFPTGNVSIQWKDKKGNHYASFIEKKQDLNKVVRKTVHFTEFMMLFLILYFAFSVFAKKIKKKAMFSILLCIMIAVLDEIHQSLVVGRTALFGDVIIDTSGALLCLVIIVLVNYIRGDKSI